MDLMLNANRKELAFDGAEWQKEDKVISCGNRKFFDFLTRAINSFGEPWNEAGGNSPLKASGTTDYLNVNSCAGSGYAAVGTGSVIRRKKGELSRRGHIIAAVDLGEMNC